MDALNEIDKNFLKNGTTPKMQLIATQQLLGFTATAEGCNLIAKSTVLSSLLQLLRNSDILIMKAICEILVNISATDYGTYAILQTSDKDRIVQTLIEVITKKENEAADSAAMALCNMTRTLSMIKKVLPELEPLNETITKLLTAFLETSTRKEGYTLDHIALIFCNLSRDTTVRSYFLDKKDNFLAKLVPFADFEDSAVRRRGVLGTIKNCCFSIDDHEWLLKDLDILPKLLLPIAGGEEFNDEDNDKLPLELQFLDEGKQREASAEVRREVLETLNQLCTTRVARNYMREKNVYVILREYHKWEQDKECMLTCENVVDILIRTEEEIGRDSLVEGLEVTEEMAKKFEAMDNAYLEDLGP